MEKPLKYIMKMGITLFCLLILTGAILPFIISTALLPMPIILILVLIIIILAVVTLNWLMQSSINKNQKRRRKR